MHRVRCGDIVREIDGRHTGAVVMVIGYGAQIKVRWDDTGWVSFLDRGEYERADDGRAYLLEVVR